MRAEDIVCRYGGEEFTIILPDTTVAGACARAESVRSAVESLQILIGSDLHDAFSISIGAAFFPSDGETSDQLLRRADLALYRAKRQGRNQAALYEAVAVEREGAR